jgi:hypothetical protein
MTLKVMVPLALALNGDAVVFPFATAVEFGPEVGHRDTPYWLMWCPQGGVQRMVHVSPTPLLVCVSVQLMVVAALQEAVC